MKFIKKNGRIIPIREKGDLVVKSEDMTTKEKIKYGAAIGAINAPLVGFGAAMINEKKSFKSGLIGAGASVLAGVGLSLLFKKKKYSYDVYNGEDKKKNKKR